MNSGRLYRCLSSALPSRPALVQYSSNAHLITAVRHRATERRQGQGSRGQRSLRKRHRVNELGAARIFIDSFLFVAIIDGVY